MLSYLQAVILGLLQGLTELFPISSLGHSVLLPGLLGWHLWQTDNFFLIFLVATHFATALVLVVFYRQDWIRIVRGILRSLKRREIGDPDAKLGWLLVTATVPAGIMGVLFEEQIRNFFLSAKSAAFFLALNGVLLLLAEVLRKRASLGADSRDADQRIAKLTWGQALKVGAMQILALLPGFSRTGATIAGSLMVGLSHEDALRYSFLLATPIIGAAAVLKLPELSSLPGPEIKTALVGAVCAAVAAYFSVRFLTKYFQTKTLRPFAIYCLAASLVAWALLR
jgi:undecaprenyl-diphosphatase